MWATSCAITFRSHFTSPVHTSAVSLTWTQMFVNPLPTLNAKPLATSSSSER